MFYVLSSKRRQNQFAETNERTIVIVEIEMANYEVKLLNVEEEVPQKLILNSPEVFWEKTKDFFLRKHPPGPPPGNICCEKISFARANTNKREEHDDDDDDDDDDVGVLRARRGHRLRALRRAFFLARFVA